MDKNSLKALRISRIKGLGPVSFSKALNLYSDITLLASEIECGQLGIEIREAYKEVNLEPILETLSKHGVGYTYLSAPDYPNPLTYINDPPTILYYKGNTELLNSTMVSVVGTRKVSALGESTANSLAERLVSSGVCVVSGMAYGVDAAVHNRCLELGGDVIAVIPGGPHRAVPAGNRYLYNKVLDGGGLILSEDLPGTKIVPGLFPRRNRIIAGLSSKLVVVEAGRRSGAIISAKLAFDYGREVYAFPYGVNQASGSGNNWLIKSLKAQLIESVQDLSLEGLRNISRRGFEDLADEERKIVDVIRFEPLSIMQLCDKLDTSIADILRSVGSLRLNNIIFMDEKQRYCLSSNV